MKAILLSFSLLVGVAVGSVPTNAQNTPKPPTAPAIPSEAAEAERGALTQAALLVSKGQFAEAEARLKPLQRPAVVQVYVDWLPVPATLQGSYRRAAQNAMHSWNAGLGGATRFQAAERAEEADLLVLFERRVARTQNGPVNLACEDFEADSQTVPPGTAPHRAARLYIALNMPSLPGPHSEASIAHLFGQGFGTYLGLGPSAGRTELMGPDTHLPNVALQPSVAELSRVRQIQEARVKLLDYAHRRVVVYLPKPAIVIANMEADAGDVWRGEKPHFVFTVKNSGDAPLEIVAKPNCGCTVANYDKVIAPGASGKIEADVNTAAFRGRIQKQITVTSNDPNTPQLALHLTANVKSLLSVLPSEAPVIGLKDGGPTVQEFQIQAADKEPVEISRVTSSAAYATTKVEPLPGGASGNPGYKLTVTIGPEAPVGRSVFLLTVQTTSKREPTLNITAICDKGILAMPVSAFLGSIGPATTLPVNQVVTLQRREGTFHLKQVDTGDANLQVQQETVKEGQEYRLRLAYKGGWPVGVVQRKITVQTDDPRQPSIVIPVFANVVSGTTAQK